MNMGSPNPAQLHRRPYTPEKYSPEGGRKRFHPSAGPQQAIEFQSDWASDARTMWDSQFEALDTYSQMRRSSGSGSGAAGHTCSARGYEPPQMNGHTSLQPTQEGRPMSRYIERPPDYRQQVSYDGRLSQGFFEEHSTFAQPDNGPYATRHDQSTAASHRMYSSHAASLRDSFSQQQQMMDNVSYPQRASLATGVPVDVLGSTIAKQAAANQQWPGSDLLQVEELQQELANAQAAERSYLVRWDSPVSTLVLTCHPEAPEERACELKFSCIDIMLHSVMPHPGIGVSSSLQVPD